MFSYGDVSRTEVSLLKDISIGTAARGDRIGKVFCVLNQDMRKCLICDEVFTRQAAVEHAGTPCFPSQRSPKLDGETADANW